MEEEIADYEQEREHNIQRNKARLQELGLASTSLPQQSRSAEQQHHVKKQKRQTDTPDAPTAPPARQSQRAAAAKAKALMQTQEGDATAASSRRKGTAKRSARGAAPAERDDSNTETSSSDGTGSSTESDVPSSSATSDGDSEDERRAAQVEVGMDASQAGGQPARRGRGRPPGRGRGAAGGRRGSTVKQPARASTAGASGSTAPGTSVQGRRSAQQRRQPPPTDQELAAIFQMLQPEGGVVGKEKLRQAMVDWGLGDHVDKLDDMLVVAGIQEGAGLTLTHLVGVRQQLFPWYRASTPTAAGTTARTGTAAAS